MHIVVAWEVYATGERQERLKTELKGALAGYSWVRAFGSVYVVKVDSEEDRQALGNALKEICRANDGLVHLIYSPAMAGGRYNGWLPRRLWEKLRARAQ